MNKANEPRPMTRRASDTQLMNLATAIPPYQAEGRDVVTLPQVVSVSPPPADLMVTVTAPTGSTDSLASYGSNIGRIGTLIANAGTLGNTELLGGNVSLVNRVVDAPLVATAAEINYPTSPTIDTISLTTIGAVIPTAPSENSIKLESQQMGNISGYKSVLAAEILKGTSEPTANPVSDSSVSASEVAALHEVTPAAVDVLDTIKMMPAAVPNSKEMASIKNFVHQEIKDQMPNAIVEAFSSLTSNSSKGHPFFGKIFNL